MRKLKTKQECIPVGCVLSAAVAISGGVWLGGGGEVSACENYVADGNEIVDSHFASHRSVGVCTHVENDRNVHLAFKSKGKVTSNVNLFCCHEIT